ncbi:MAG: transcription termination factor NusA [Candidatus Eremiobacteraeota bacterium]|nr:transcription termination factor NusA [Candidatus Eremiobacteraeota bacterium]
MNPDFIAALKQIEKERAIPLEVILGAIEDALGAAYKRNYGPTQNVAIKIDRITGALQATAQKTVVARVSDPQNEITLAKAKKINPDAQKGDEIDMEVTPSDFGRIAAQTAKQVIVQRIREAEREIIFTEFTKREEDVISGVVQRYEQKNCMVDLGKLEGVLPSTEQVAGEHFKHGDRIKALILEVKKTARGPQVVLSRSHPNLIKRLFEMEVPEISSGLITIKSVVREPGHRSKIAVVSKDTKVDPVGACVGPKGSRVQNIVDELKGEKIDIISWSADPTMYLSNSLSPAKVVTVILYDYDKSAFVVVPDHQLSLAIGKEGQNVRLAAKLTGWKIDIKSESQYGTMKEELEAKAAEMARLKAEEEARKKAELEARKKAEEEARKKASEEAQKKASEEAQKKASEEAQKKASEVAEQQAVDEVRRKLEEEARLKAEEEARKWEEEERLRREAEERWRTEEEARLKTEAAAAPSEAVESEAAKKKKKRKERRAEEEMEDMAPKKKKKAKRTRLTEEEVDEYEEYFWKEVR